MNQVTEKDVRRIQGRVRQAELDAPDSFLTESAQTIAANVNLCGTDGVIGDLVPEKILGYYIGDCCVIHDWDYFDGEPDESVRDKADRRFRNNLTRELGNAMKSSFFYRIVKRLVRRAINIYYKAVRSFGGPAFWDGKNEAKL